ncbi:hypothetical protein JB92DRAFT_3001653 [Gautieria morchelliformis]|nr:hypothetical protein JB92DRAFT_3001653 [Gautieria morchelliformis]
MGALTNRYEDDDASHLPPGMKRVGYDADTERYTFREGDDLWLGEPGSFYGGRMKWAGKMPQADGDDGKEDDIDGSSAGYSGQWSSAVTHQQSLVVFNRLSQTISTSQ